MRFVLIAMLVACSNGAKREDAPMPPKQAPGDAAATVPSGPVAKVFVTAPGGEVQVNVEVVATEAKIERGLMFRQAMALDAGMLFMLGQERDWAFWMRNTLIPLDMLFIAKDKTVAGIVENAEPRTETLRQVGKMSFYVLEVNGGWAKSHNVTAGAKVRFENVQE